MSFVKLTIAPLLVGVAVVTAFGLAGVRMVGSSPAAAAPTPAPAFRPPSTATPVPQSALVPHANAYLGYSIKLPPAYRRAAAFAHPQNTGRDLYTPRTAQEDQALCARKPGSLQPPERVADLKVGVYANPGGVSPVAFASAPERKLAFTSVIATNIGGRDAARVVHQPSGDTAFFVIAANGRLYEIAPMAFEQPTTQPAGWIDQIAQSFTALPPQAGTATSTPPLCG